MLFALLALTLAQAPVPVPYPDEPAPAEPPLVEMAPLQPAPVETPLRPEEIPPPPPKPAAIQGLDGFTTGLVQAGVGTGVSGVFTGALAVLRLFIVSVPALGSVVLALDCVNCLVMPGAVAVIETAVGDAVGKRRGASLWPMLASYGGCCLHSTVSLAVYFIFAAGAVSELAQGGDPALISARLAADPALQVSNIVLTVLGPVFIGVPPAIAYAFNAEDKKPGDPGGLSLPGFMTPNHAGPMSTVPSTSGRSVMRF